MRLAATMLALPICVAATASAAPVGSEFQVNSYTTLAQSRPAVSHDAVGQGQDGSSSGVFGQRYDSSGIPSGAEFQINGTRNGDSHLFWVK